MVLATVWLGACKKEIDELLTFEIKNERTFPVPKESLDPNLAVMNFPVSVATNSDKEFQENNTLASLVKDIRLSEASFELPDNSTEDFGFLEDMEVYIAMPDGSDRVLLAEAHNIPANVGKRLVLTPSGNKMDKYVKSDEYAISMQGKMRRPVNDDLTVTSKIVFKVTAAVL
ncbi:MAG TPA: hypothetical protein VK927_11495 [Adhaeribacter sp.]|nr:hypothetical protein [Adhaeribacter sp.]